MHVVGGDADSNIDRGMTFTLLMQIHKVMWQTQGYLHWRKKEDLPEEVIYGLSPDYESSRRETNRKSYWMIRAVVQSPQGSQVGLAFLLNPDSVFQAWLYI